MMNPHVPYQKKEIVPHSPAINNHLKSEVSITLNCQLYLTCYTALQVKSCSKSKSAIIVATMKNIDDFHSEGKPSHATTKSTPFAVSKDKWDAKEDTSKSMTNALHVLRYNKRHMST